MGLREVKKQRVRNEIQETAIALFRERGIDGARVRDIIERVEISEATFFNYFPSKAAVLSAWAHRLVAGSWVSSDPPSGRNLRRQIREHVRQLGDRISADREFLAAVWPRLRLDSVRPSASEPDAVATDMFRSAQARSEIRADLAPEQLAELLAGAIHHTVASWLLTPGTPLNPLVPRLQGAVDLLLDGCRKRNERVRAQGVARSVPGHA